MGGSIVRYVLASLAAVSWLGLGPGTLGCVTSDAVDAVDSRSADTADAGDAVEELDACQVAATPDTPIPIACVSFLESTVPASEAPDLDAWWDGTCDSATSFPPAKLECPDLESGYLCKSVSSLGPLGSWLDGRVDALNCISCPQDPENASICGCVGGLDQHYWGFSGVSCDYVLLKDADGTIVSIESPAELAQRFAPVTTPAKAMAFVELVGRSVRHLYSRQDFFIAGTMVENSGISHETRCSVNNLEGSWAETEGPDFIVRTYKVPDENGCTSEALVQVTYRVTREGVVSLEASDVVCTASIPCYD